MNDFVSPAALQQFSISNNQLMLGGFTMGQISQLLGQSAFYAYDRNVIQSQIELLRHLLPAQLKLHYAIKANPLPAVVNYMASHVDGFDVASHQEMLLAMQAGMSPSQISFAGPGKNDTELKAAILAGVTIHIESLYELQRVERFGIELEREPQVAIRVNPQFELKSSGMKMAGGAKPFGIDEEQVFALLNQFCYQVRLRGFHIYAGSQNLNAEALAQAHRQTLALAARLTAISPQSVDLLNIGGGFGIAYFPHESKLDVAAVATHLAQTLDEYADTFKDIEIVLELGRFLVGPAGVYCCQVLDKKVSRETTYLVCNGGLHHHLANSGNFGQVIRKNYPVLLANKISSSVTEQVTIVGPLCTPLDVLAERVVLPVADIGDWVVVLQSGAYGASASPHGFLSQTAVGEILL